MKLIKPKYMRAIEKNVAPTAAQISQGAGYDPEAHGYHGQVNTSFPVSLSSYTL
jgi:hypothetical protein